MGVTWDQPGAEPLRDIREWMRAQETYRPSPFAVLALPPLGCPDCGMALPSCHQQHSREHCARHDRPVCAWARGEPDG